MTTPIVDYFSFTVPIPCLMSQWETADRLQMGNLFDDRTSDLLELFASQTNWREFKQSGRFPRGIRFTDIGMTYAEGDKSDVSLIQLSGEGCQWMRDNNCLELVLETWKDRATRIDVAIDFVSSVDPRDFATMLSNKRFKAEAMEKSNTGITYYIGSYKSDRFARVYRYTPETGRRQTLRLEYQFGNDAAKHCAEMCCNEGVFDVAIQLGNYYGWEHPDYILEKTDTKFSSPSRPKTRVGKELWLRKQVIPSLIKEVENGNREIVLWLRDKLSDILDGDLGILTTELPI